MTLFIVKTEESAAGVYLVDLEGHDAEAVKKAFKNREIDWEHCEQVDFSVFDVKVKDVNEDKS